MLAPILVTACDAGWGWLLSTVVRPWLLPQLSRNPLEAIQAYTLNGAKQMGRAHAFGSIEVGKKADLVLLNQNLFKIKSEAIPATKVLATMAGGRLVHDVAYGIGDADLTNLEQLDQGAVGLCPYGDHEGHPHRNGHAH